MINQHRKQFMLFAVLTVFPFLALGDCKVLIVVGMPDEAEAALSANTESTEIVIGTGNFKVLRKKLSEVQLDNIKAVISFGVAGGLNPEISEGSIVLATRSLYRDQVIEADERLRLFLTQQTQDTEGLTVRNGVFLSDDQWLGLEAGESSTLFKTTLADSTDNESFFAAEFAQQKNLPFAGIRAISDGPDVTLPPAASLPFNEDGSPDLSAIFGSIITEPSQLPDLWELSKRYEKALDQLALFMKSVDFQEYLQESFNECQ